jgi:hypothetical protein
VNAGGVLLSLPRLLREIASRISSAGPVEAEQVAATVSRRLPAEQSVQRRPLMPRAIYFQGARRKDT